MQIIIKGKNLDVSEALEKYATKKVEKLSKYFPALREAIIAFSIQKNQRIVEVTIEGEGVLLRGEERTDSMYASIDLVVEKLEKQLKRYKGKIIDKTREEAQKKGKEQMAQSMLELQEGEEAEEEPAPEIVRTKRFILKPMPPEEAAMQMELLGHNFFIFLNSDTDLVSVIYKRKDGGYGVLEPEA